MEIGRWVHIGDKNTIRCHEGSLRFGDKVVLGRDNVDQHLPRHRARRFGADGGLGLRLRLRPPDGRHQRADQGPGHRQEPGTDRARTPGSRPRSRSCATPRIGRGCVLGRTPWSRATSPTTRSRSARRPRWSRTASCRGRRRRPQRAELAAALADIERKKAAR